MNSVKKMSQKKCDFKKSLSLRRDSDKTLELTGFWTPPVPYWKPLRKKPNSTLRLACVVEDRLYHGLRFEGEVMLLTPHNWKQVLKYGKPDFLLMESIWTTATGHWHMGQYSASPKRDELLQIIALARKQSIPTVYWITKGHEYHEHYKDFARHFDYVFCADSMETELLRAEGIKAEVLLPCVQPALYNPFRIYNHYNTFSLNIIFDGWADLDRLTDNLSVMQDIKSYGLSIIESRYQIFRRRMNGLPDYQECILGCVSDQSRIVALKYAKAYVTFDKTLSTKTTQQWMTIEAAASRLAVVHHGILPNDDLRKGIIIDRSEHNEFLVEFIRFQEDDLYRERLGHLGWRNVYLKHTFAHRVQTICKKIGKEFDWHEFPKVSLITPTYRSDFLPRCFKTYEQQTYPNKELIVVFNGNYVPFSSELGLKNPRDDVRIVNVPEELFAGACLNLGHVHAEGDYCFRVDDDDYYGPNYILDMMLHARCIDADFFGKPPAPIIFEDENTVYARKSISHLSIIPQELLIDGRVWLGGNSIAGSNRFFKGTQYQDALYGAADSALMYNLNPDHTNVCAIMDDLNLVAERRMDQTTHTWKIASSKLKNNEKINSIRDFMI